jgi:hypothetical protein
LRPPPCFDSVLFVRDTVSALHALCNLEYELTRRSLTIENSLYSFVYIDQTTAKLSKTLEVAFDSWEGCSDGEAGMWARASSMEEALEIAVGFLEKYNL